MKQEITLKNNKTGKEVNLVRKPPQQPVNIRRVASKPSGRRSA